MGVNSIMNDAGRIGFVVKGTYDNTATYDFLDVVYYNNATYVAKKLTVGNEPQSSSEFWQVLMDGGVNFNDIAPTFTQAETRENINSGEKLPVLFGKIKKWYTDLKAVAFSGSYNDLSDTPTIPAAVAVKGNAESSYRKGNVNLTPANIGAVPTANVLDSRESITANTASGNVAGALGTKEINANLQSQIDTLNSNLTNKVDATTDMHSLLYRKYISTWTDKSQVSGMTGLYYIADIDNTLWNEINQSDLTNVGDYTLVLIGTNGNAEGGAAYATGFLVSPRWDTNFGYFKVWNSNYEIYKAVSSKSS